jgi:hypothetical protein
MPRTQSLAPHHHFERARDCEGRSKSSWGADYWQGGVPGQGVVFEGVKGVKYPPMLPECTKTAKNQRF